MKFRLLSNPTCLPALIAALWTVNVFEVRAQTTTLTPEQIEAIQAQIKEIRDVVEGHASELNRSAGDVFRRAAQDPKAAVELYAKCYREVHFVREGKEDEYREWEDRMKDTFKESRFLEGLMVQLRYLALSCEAAEAEKLEVVFPSLLAYVESLNSLTEVPSPQVLVGVNQSVFAQAYNLDGLLSRNKEWEMVPFDIPGIYEKTVLPFLRANDPTRLMAAWDKRIVQQTQMSAFVSSMEQKGSNRDDRKASENRARQLEDGRTGNVIRQHNENEFQENTLPLLQWARLKDMALYVDPVQGVSGLLAFLKEHTNHQKAQDWLDEMQALLGQLGSAARAAAPQSAVTPPAPAPATVPAPATPAGVATPGVIGGVPRGLE